ncbi:ATP-binding protein [Psychrobacter glaciei]|uniref:ATP-binding protein n=1 Tax=Psychrobacter glaciei TaxID=619771 RepID=A0ABQ3GLP4_9GAMM|nr:AAA family ATPase [Psychrobacter glaciei]GHD25566.1 ATP-binding protein [Psychrobacter glaciei]
MFNKLENIIKSFEIKGLYSERNVRIDFEDNIKIIVAENGYGKTTILNVLYTVLSGNLNKLQEVDFKSIHITFFDDEKVSIRKSNLSYFLLVSKYGIKESNLHGFISDKYLKNDVYSENKKSESDLNVLRKQLLKYNDIIKNKILEGDIYENEVFLKKIENNYFKNKGLSVSEIRDSMDRIKIKFPYKIVYLPTYRRVEHNLKEISGNDFDKIDSDNLIKFGMEDVNKIFKDITDEIITSSIEWFSKVNGQMLSQLVTGIKINRKIISSIENPEAIRIVLDRIGDNIKEDSKQEILRLVESKEIFQGHDQLIYFISNLVEVYQKQRSNDKAIQDFSEVCNKYLVDKKIHYNESKVTISIVRRKNKREVNIENLSSGEKQIISLFARLYLKKENNLAIFYDEPELSLSMEWQKKLLPDIINSGKCAFMFVTTHSPFIFENELISNTVDLGTYIEEL